MNIGLFGSYNRLNFGDDLLAYYISSELSKKHDITVFTQSKALKLPKHVNSTNDMESFVYNSDKLVLGGGGFLTATSDEMLEEMLTQLLPIAESYQKPLVILSIGGDQKPKNEVLSYLGKGRKALFDYPYLEKCILRTHEEFGTNDARFAFEEDVLWGCVDRISEPYHHATNTKVMTIGIHLSSARILKTTMALVECISFIAFRKIRFIYFQTHDEKINNLQELKPFLPFRTNYKVHNGDVVDFIESLKKIDILISAKMHIGLLCLSMGIPTVSFGGPEKAKNLLRKLGMDNNILESSPRQLLLLLVKLITKRNYIHSIESDLLSKTGAITQIKVSSLNNFKFI